MTVQTGHQSTSNRRGTALRRRGRAVAALGLSALVVTACTGTSSNQDHKDSSQADPTVVPANATNVLQSVAVQVQPDGQVNGINSTAVASSGSAEDATTVRNSWPGAQASGDLPVRVHTTYKQLGNDGKATRTGTNLTELNGHPGRVEIDVTVENLTVKAQDVDVDVNGRSRTQKAMVGVPLSVVAATQMKGVTAAQVVTPSASSTRPATNGVLSQGDDGDTVVQWATLLAPPTTRPTTTLKLVVDATKDFTAPAFDVSVQPGLVGDSSLGALFDASMSSTDSPELQLQRQTIELAGKVNQVVAQAGRSIDTMRDNLQTTSQTLGNQTVDDLTASSQSIGSSMKALDGQLAALKGNIGDSMKQTNSVVLQSLAETVDASDRMLGDTSSAPAAPRVASNSCQVSTTRSTASTSVYGNLMQAVGAMKAYAASAEQCRGQVRTQLGALLGPASPQAARSCPNPTTVSASTPMSVTCSMYVARRRFDSSVAQQLEKDGQTALAALQPQVLATTLASTALVSGDVDALSAQGKALATLTAARQAGLDAVTKKLAQTTDDVTSLDARIAGLNQLSVANQKKLAELVAQNKAAADALCEPVATPSPSASASDGGSASASPSASTSANDSAPASAPANPSASTAPNPPSSATSSATATPTATQTPSTTASATATATASASGSASGSATPGAAASVAASAGGGTVTAAAAAPSATTTPTAPQTATTTPAATQPVATVTVTETQTATATATTTVTETASTAPDAKQQRIDLARALLTTESCPDASGRSTALKRPEGYPQAMSELLAQQQAQWQQVEKQTAASTAGEADMLATVRSDLADVAKLVAAADKQRTEDDAQLATTSQALTDALAKLGSDRTALVTQMAQLEQQQKGLAEAVTKAFATASKNGTTTVDSAIDLAVRQTSQQGQLSTQAIDQMFAAAASGLGNSANGLAGEAEQTVRTQRDQVHRSSQQTSTQVSQQLSSGLGDIAGTVGASTKDMQAANVQLSQDLRSVLLDLGTRSVKGSGLLGAMTSSAATAGSASYSLGQASTQVTNYANLRNQDMVGLLTARAQARAGAQLQEELPIFKVQIPEQARHRTVYSFHIGAK